MFYKPRIPVLRFMRRVSIVCLTLVFLQAPAVRAEDTVVTVDPAQTRIEFVLDSSLHTVHGTFKLKSGTVRFDPATGKASGSIIVDARSGQSGNDGRDKKMHKEILESEKFPEIVFTPAEVKGTVPKQGASEVEVSGVFRLHGQDHDMTMKMTLIPDGAGRVQAETHFAIPYIKWGLKNPSTFILRASDTVQLEIHGVGQFTGESGSR